MEIYDKEQVGLELKNLIQNWLSEKEGRSVVSLARNSNVSENCIRRVLNQNSIPTTENLVKITSYLTKATNHNDLFKKLDQTLKNHIKFELPFLNFIEMSSYKSIPEYEHIFTNHTIQFIFERSSIADGITVAEITKNFNQFGLEQLNILIENQLVQVMNETVKARDEIKNHTWSTTQCKNLSAEIIKNYYKTDSQINYIFNINDGVSKRGYGQIMDVLEAAHQKVYQIIQSEKGQIPVSVVGFMDTLSNENYFNK